MLFKMEIIRKLYLFLLQLMWFFSLIMCIWNLIYRWDFFLLFFFPSLSNGAKGSSQNFVHHSFWWKLSHNAFILFTSSTHNVVPSSYFSWYLKLRRNCRYCFRPIPMKPKLLYHQKNTWFLFHVCPYGCEKWEEYIYEYMCMKMPWNMWKKAALVLKSFWFPITHHHRNRISDKRLWAVDYYFFSPLYPPMNGIGW